MDILEKFEQLMALVEADEPDEPTDEPGKHRRADNPEKGHARHFAGDMSGPSPEVNPISGQVAPRLAGERSKAQAIVDRVRNFIEKYGDYAVDTFRGFDVSKDAQGREVAGREKVQNQLSKAKALALIDRLPTMPSSQMMFAVRVLGNFVWTVHANIRKDIRDNVKQSLSKQKGGKVDQDDPAYQAALKAASREFDTDSTNIKADLNVLAQASGFLKKSTGGGGKADQTYLQKVGGGFGKPPEIVPAEPTAKLSPDMKKLSGYEPASTISSPDQPKASRGPRGAKPAVQAKGPVIKRGARPEFMTSKTSDDEAEQALRDMGLADSYRREFDRGVEKIFEIAAADRTPKWWEDI